MFFFVGYFFQDLFKIARSLLVKISSSFYSGSLVKNHVVQPYNNTDTANAWKKSRIYFITEIM